MEWVEGLPWGSITPMALLLLLIGMYTRLLLSGEMVPERLADREVRQRDETIKVQREQIEALTEAAKIDAETIRELTRQNSQLIESGRVTDSVLKAISKRAGET